MESVAHVTDLAAGINDYYFRTSNTKQKNDGGRLGIKNSYQELHTNPTKLVAIH